MQCCDFSYWYFSQASKNVLVDCPVLLLLLLTLFWWVNTFCQKLFGFVHRFVSF
ncbi:hypothetical protein JCM19238_365 [Vibrio ponticus]|nr:hypothetical protein JCM19238_365 [Vibrio ponticus]